MSGWAVRHCFQVVHTKGTVSSVVPLSGPLIAVPSSWGHCEPVCRSYISRLELTSRPVVPKVSSGTPGGAESPITVPVSGQ